MKALEFFVLTYFLFEWIYPTKPSEQVLSQALLAKPTGLRYIFLSLAVVKQ